MPKLMERRGKRGNWYANCRHLGIKLSDCLETTDERLAEKRLAELKILVERGEYKLWKKTFEQCCDEYVSGFDLNKPNHGRYESIVRVHLKPHFGKSGIVEIAKRTLFNFKFFNNSGSSASPYKDGTLNLFKVAIVSGLKSTTK